MTLIPLKVTNGDDCFKASDVFYKLGLPYNGARTLSKIFKFDGYYYNNRGYHLTVDQIDKVCEYYKIENPFTNCKESKLKKLEAKLDQLKTEIKNLSNTKGLPKETNSAKIDKQLVKEARDLINRLCRDYVSAQMKKVGESASSLQTTLFDLAYNRLYSAFKEVAKDNIDLKKLAEDKSSLLGKKVSVLEVAEKEGRICDLYNVAKIVFKH